MLFRSVIADQHMRNTTIAAPATTRATTLTNTAAAHNTAPSMTPRPQHAPTNRASQPASTQNPLDFDNISSYDLQQCLRAPRKGPSVTAE